VTSPLVRPPRKNPVLRTRVPNLPPGMRSRVALGLTAAAALGRFELQVCRDCGRVQYPPREACCVCLSPRLDWRVQDGAGELLSETMLRHSFELFFRERMPWRLGMIRLDCGPVLVAHLHGDCSPAPARVRVRAKLRGAEAQDKLRMLLRLDCTLEIEGEEKPALVAELLCLLITKSDFA